MTVPCSTLLLLAGTWGNCLTFRVEDEAAVEEENEGPECGCTLRGEMRDRERGRKAMETLASSFSAKTIYYCLINSKYFSHQITRSAKNV